MDYAPYLDLRPLAETDQVTVAALLARPECAWITSELEHQAQNHAIAHVVPGHLDEVRSRRQAVIDKTRDAVKDRLTKEITYWDHRAADLMEQESAGKANARLNSQEARRRADDLQARLQQRLEQLDLERQIAPLPPVVIAGLVVVPRGLLLEMAGVTVPTRVVDTQQAAAAARAIVMQVEIGLGNQPTDREADKVGYDIESLDARTGSLRFIEVKGRVSGAPTVTVTRNEILYSLNRPEHFILALVEFLPAGGHRVHYLRQPFHREPDFGVTSVNYDFAELLAKAGEPS